MWFAWFAWFAWIAFYPHPSKLLTKIKKKIFGGIYYIVVMILAFLTKNTLYFKTDFGNEQLHISKHHFFK